MDMLFSGANLLSPIKLALLALRLGTRLQRFVPHLGLRLLGGPLSSLSACTLRLPLGVLLLRRGGLWLLHHSELGKRPATMGDRWFDLRVSRAATSCTI